VDALPCQASDLEISAITGGYPTYLEFYVRIANISHSTCYLQGPADIKLVDRNGDVLELEYSSVCFGCRIDRTLPSPTRTAMANEMLYGKIGIAPNERVGVSADWSEWCKPFPEGGIFVRLVLPDGFVEGPTDAYVGAPCRLNDARSYLWVSRYYYLSYK
jgi:hypothetical protein